MLGGQASAVFLLPSAAHGRTAAKRAHYTYGTDDIQVQLVFYSTFEPVVLPGGCPMEAVGVQKLYEPSPTPILHVGPAAKVMGNVPCRC